MEIEQAIALRRSVRSFAQDPIDRELLSELVAAARLAPAGANMQPLEYVVVTDPELCQKIFACLKWAAYTAPLGTPDDEHRPTAYVAVCVRPEYKSKVGSDYDVGAALGVLTLLAAARGLGSCWLKNINYPKASRLMGLPEGLKLDSIVALGAPAEEPTVVDLEPGQSGAEVIRYWRDEAGRQFVPKRALADILHWDKY